MKRFYVVLFALLIFFSVMAFPGAVAGAQNKSYWLETYQGTGSLSVMPLLTCPDGGILAVSYVKDANGIRDSVLTKVTSNGSVKWKKEYFGGRVIINALARATDGNVVAAGVYIPNETSRFSNGLLMEIDRDGNVVWAKSYGGNGTDIISGLTVLNDGSILAVGLTTSFNAGRGDIWLLKVDSRGNILWERTYGTLEMDEGIDLEIIPGGDIVVVGLLTSGGVPHGIVLRVDENGDLKWAREYTTGSELTILKILPTKDGGFHILGYANLGNGTLGALLMKLDGNGKIVWARDYYTKGVVLGRDMAIDPSGNLWLSGMAVTGEGDNTTYYGVLLGMHDGNITAERVYGPGIVFKSIMFGQLGDLWVGGLFRVNTSEGVPLVGKLHSDGTLPGCKYLSSLNIDVSTPDIAVRDISMAVSKPHGTSRDVIINAKELRTQPSLLCTYKEGEEKRGVCGPALMVFLVLSFLPLFRRRS